MMRPWHIWVAYAVAALVVTPAMVLLTMRALELDRAEATARAAAAQESRLGSALWRMDTLLTRVLAPEIGRPYYVYEPFYATGAKGGRAASPLLTLPSRFVKLHFQVDAQENWSSPQCPAPSDEDLAVQNGADPGSLQVNRRHLEQLVCDVKSSTLAVCLPEDTVAVLPSDRLANAAASPDRPRQQAAGPPVMNSADVYGQQGQVLELPQQSTAFRPGPQQGQMASQLRDNVTINSNDLRNRGEVLQAEASRQRIDQLSIWTTNQVSAVREGVSQPVWLGEKLLIARRVWIGEREVFQGCWLNWEGICQELKQRVADLLTDVELEPLRTMADVRVNRVLATLPAQLVAGPPVVTLPFWSPIRAALLAAWSFLVLAATGVAWLLQAVVGLSERRAAFVSAVTHELRTPLTTFQMYSEMLAKGMIRDPARQKLYLDTLQNESHRLSHLVENVLLYARLERAHAPQRRIAVSVSNLLQRATERLQARAAEASLRLEVDMRLAVDEQDLQVLTDPGAVEQILFNLVDNACKYGRSAEDPRLLLTVMRDRRQLVLRLSDHGPGVPPEVRRTLFRPFSKSAERAAESAPGVGLGLALSRRLARQLAGQLTLRDPAGRGATFELRLPLV